MEEKTEFDDYLRWIDEIGRYLDGGIIDDGFVKS